MDKLTSELEFPVYGECNPKTQTVKEAQRETEYTLLQQISRHLLLKPNTNVDKYCIQQLECQDITSNERFKFTNSLIERFQNEII